MKSQIFRHTHWFDETRRDTLVGSVSPIGPP